jgi:hypothetical protein
LGFRNLQEKLQKAWYLKQESKLKIGWKDESFDKQQQKLQSKIFMHA